MIRFLSIISLLILPYTALQENGNQSSVTRVIRDAGSHAQWTYDNPLQWPQKFKTCGGKQQSPININLARVKNMKITSPLTFQKYQSILPMTMKNNGHSVELDPIVKSDLPSIVSGGLPGRYIFAQLHFHWGDNSLYGSEHAVNQKVYPGELHIVHYNQKYGSVANAVNYPDGLAVLAIFLQKEKLDNPIFRHIVPQLKEIQNVGKKIKLTMPVTLRDLLPSKLDTFFRYHGSLTTPTCAESVSWTVFREPIPISETQLNFFRILYDSRGRQLKKNTRPVQIRNGRRVFYTKG